jgi:hypothetical protein
LTILRGTSSKKWTHEDRVLAVAHVMAGDLICPDCGQPKHESFNPDSEGWYTVKEEICNGCLAISRDQKARKDGDYQPEVKLHVVDERPPDELLRPWTPG